LECTVRVQGEAQVNGFSNNSYKGYQTQEEAEEELNQFLADEAMSYEAMTVPALSAQGMDLQALPVEGMPVQAMPHHAGHRVRDFIIVVMLVVIARLLFFM
jgi:hypothetical protein